MGKPANRIDYSNPSNKPGQGKIFIYKHNQLVEFFELPTLLVQKPHLKNADGAINTLKAIYNIQHVNKS